MINAIVLEEERGRAPNLSVEQARNLFRLGTGRDTTFQSSLVTSEYVLRIGLLSHIPFRTHFR